VVRSWATVRCRHGDNPSTRMDLVQPLATGSFMLSYESFPDGSKLVKVLADLPSGPSRADPLLKHDTLDLISKMESAAGRPGPQVEDVKLLKNGKEVWLLKTGRDGIAYIVDFKQSAQGGTDIGLSKPQSYKKTNLDNVKGSTLAKPVKSPFRYAARIRVCDQGTEQSRIRLATIRTVS
jgi:hypothetical protein